MAKKPVKAGAIEKVAKSSKRGSRPGEKRGGRKKGIPNKKTAAVIEAVEKSGITPLEYMLNVMRMDIPADADPLVKIAMVEQRFEAAKAAAPYVHPRLAAIEHTGKGGGPIQSEATLNLSPEEAYKRMLHGG